MAENIETRISSTQAKDAIYKAHSISSSASEIDNTVLMVGNVKNYGNIGNGEDATLAFQSCAAANPKGGIIFVPSGNYYVENIPLDTGAPDYIPYRWIGSGISSTILRLPSAPSFDMFTTTLLGGTVRGGEVSGFTMYGDGSGLAFDGTKDCINFSKVDSLFNFHLHTNRILLFRYGCFGAKLDRSPIIENNDFTYNKAGYFVQGDHPLFRGCNDFRYNETAIGGDNIYDCNFIGQKFVRNKYAVNPTTLKNSMFVGCVLALNEKGIKLGENNTFTSGQILLQTLKDDYLPISCFELYGKNNNISSNYIMSFGSQPTEGVVSPKLSKTHGLKFNNNTIARGCGAMIIVESGKLLRDSTVNMNTYELGFYGDMLIDAPSTTDLNVDNDIIGNKFYIPAGMNLGGSTTIKVKASLGRNNISENSISAEAGTNNAVFISATLGNGGRARDNLSRRGGEILITGTNASTNPDNIYLP